MASSPASDAALALLRALADEVHTLAHDPATVRAIAQKLKNGIDSLADTLVEAEEHKPKEQDAKKS